MARDKRCAANELNNPTNQLTPRFGPVPLPIVDGCLIHAKLCGHLPLKQAQVEAAFSELVAQGL